MKSFDVKVKQVSELREWGKNQDIRSINKERYQELKKDVQERGFRDVLKVAADEVTVVGGNHRLKVLKELGIKEVTVLVTEAKTDKEIFTEAIRDNEQFAYYEDQQVAELALGLGFEPLELEKYELHLEEATKLSVTVDTISGLSVPGSEDEQGRLDEKKKVTCPECGHEFTA